MKYTIRNKRISPILTFEKNTWNIIRRDFYPDAFCLAWSAYKKEYEQITGVEISLDYVQEQEFNEWVGADARGVWASTVTPKLDMFEYNIWTSFNNGFRFYNDFRDTITVAQRFVSMFPTKLAQL